MKGFRYVGYMVDKDTYYWCYVRGKTFYLFLGDRKKIFSDKYDLKFKTSEDFEKFFRSTNFRGFVNTAKESY